MFTGYEVAFENNMQHHSTMKPNAKTYLSNRECSVRETLYHILPELKLTESFQLFILLTQILQKKEFKYYFLKKNLAKYQMIAHTFLRNQMLKDQVQHSTKENTLYLKTFVIENF